jgi:uncharacterized cupredoxin-like copper-binding protein
MKRLFAGLTLLMALAVLVTACGGDEKPSASVDVDLTEWTVKPSVTEVSAGTIKVTAHNKGTQTHEIALLSVGADNGKKEVADHEGIKAGADGSFTAKNLKAGRYELACLIAPGEEGSTVDHYQQGMHTEFIVK